MKVPILEEIKILNFEFDRLTETIPESLIGKAPCFLEINDLNEINTLRAIKNIEEALESLGIHPLMPYPFYIICNKKINSQTIRILSNREELPSHFQKKINRLKQKEVSLNAKNSILAKKIKNQNIYKKTQDIKNSAHKQRELYQVSHEIYFLNKIIEAI